MLTEEVNILIASKHGERQLTGQITRKHTKYYYYIM